MSIKILLADDSITIQKVIGIIFGGEDYSLTVVDNGKSAVEKARELCPDVLLIDALMPGMNGYEVCEAVRGTPELSDKPILILTGSFEPFDEDKAKKCGADDFLAKPFESQQIVNKVKELAELGTSRAAKALSSQTTADPEPVAVISSQVEPLVIPEPSPLPETPQAIAPSDIWEAFTPDTEPLKVADVLPEIKESGLSGSLEPDVFAIVNEESESQLVQPATEPVPPSQHTGTQWIPVEEHTFEFEEEKVATLPDAVFSEPTVTPHDPGFGEIAFEEEIPVQQPAVTTPSIEPAVSDFIIPEPEIGSFAKPVPGFEHAVETFETPVKMPEKPVAVFETPAPVFETPAADFTVPASAMAAEPPPAVTATASGALSEEQLRAAISAASKEVIERIVWEVVPDLAETLIREAIRKIKEGV